MCAHVRDQASHVVHEAVGYGVFTTRDFLPQDTMANKTGHLLTSLMSVCVGQIKVDDLVLLDNTFINCYLEISMHNTIRVHMLYS